LIRLPGVEAVYVRHTHPASPSFVPGHSDLDLTVVLSDQAAESLVKVEAVARFLERRRLFYFYLSPDDARITTPGELARMTGKWPPVEILVGPENWTLLAGIDVRRAKSKNLPPVQIAWHPEFNRWWGHILQDYPLLTMPGKENQYHRVFYRGAIKQVAYFMAARGLSLPLQESFTDGGLTRCVLDKHSGLKAMMSRLEQRGFWDGGEKNIREQIFHEVLRNTENFYRGFPICSQPALKNKLNTTQGKLHAGAYSALASKLETLPDLKSRLAGVLVYPTPYCHPYFYQADLLLPEKISIAELATLTSVLRREFRGREFESEGHHFAITLIPTNISLVPLVFRGSPFPFLAEHINQYGQVLFGPDTVVSGKASNRDLIDWCRIFLPYFTSNLNRRIEHSSRTLNFCHIAAVRLFLESGDIITDSPTLRARHEKVYGQESPSAKIWDYLLRDKPGKDDHALYLDATAHLKIELDRVEQLLEEQESQPPSGPDLSTVNPKI
jgi:hypothetical protein